MDGRREKGPRREEAGRGYEMLEKGRAWARKEAREWDPLILITSFLLKYL